MSLNSKAIEDAVSRVIPTIPEGHNVATIGLGVLVDETGVEAAVHVRKTLIGDWAIDGQAFASHEFSGRNDRGARLIMSGSL